MSKVHKGGTLYNITIRKLMKISEYIIGSLVSLTQIIYTFLSKENWKIMVMFEKWTIFALISLAIEK